TIGDGRGGFTQIFVDPTNRETVYALRNTSGTGQIFVTTDGGATWTCLTQDGGINGLGNLPVWKLVVDYRNGNLYAGTDIGVFHLYNDPVTGYTNSTWTRFGTGLPNVQVHDLVLDTVTNTLIAGTYGRSVYQLFLDAKETGANPARAALVALSGNAIWTG